jgi:hypothetical protein
MPRVGFEPTIPVFELEKTVHALDRAATVIGTLTYTEFKFSKIHDCVLKICQSQWPRRLRHDIHSFAQMLGSWVRIPLNARMSVRLFCVYVVLCVGSGLATGWSLAQGVLPTVYRIKKLKKRPRSNKRTIEPLIDRQTDRRTDGRTDRQTDR